MPFRNSERYKLWRKAYVIKNRERIRATKKAWEKAHPETTMLQRQRHRARYRDRLNAEHRAWWKKQRENPEFVAKENARCRARYAMHREELCEKQRERRAKKDGVRTRCAYCHKRNEGTALFCNKECSTAWFLLAKCLEERR